jgi:hypothetical protein
MLLMLLIGWIVLLPAIVVVGLYVGSTVLGRRRSALAIYEDLFSDEQALETEVPVVTPESIIGPLAPAAARQTPASPEEAPAPEAPPVSAGY